MRDRRRSESDESDESNESNESEGALTMTTQPERTAQDVQGMSDEGTSKFIAPCPSRPSGKHKYVYIKDRRAFECACGDSATLVSDFSVRENDRKGWR